MKHLLSFDVEEYFQVEGAAASVGPDRWNQWPHRLAPVVDRLLGLLDEHDTRATFFVLGWVAREQPNVVRRIAEAGHELASHGMTHHMLTRLAPASFRAELDESRKLLEDLAGSPIVGYRAPTFSITHRTGWAVDALADAGYRYDSSVFPVRHDRYGVPKAPTVPHVATGPGGRKLLELPMLVLPTPLGNWPAAGGGYLRLFPVRLAGLALRRAARRGAPGMVYLHPWEFDAGQPRLPMGRLGGWRHRTGLGRTEAKLRWLLKRFKFTSVAERLDELDAAAAGRQFTYGAEESRSAMAAE